MRKKLFGFIIFVFLFGIKPIISYGEINTAELSYRIKMEGEAAKYLDEVEVLYDSRIILDSKNTKTFAKSRFELDLGEPIAKTIVLYPSNKLDNNFRMHYQFETSLTIMNEGPHMDLLNWRHHSSEWIEMRTEQSNTFILENLQSQKFPAVTTHEIIDAVSAELVSWQKEGYHRGDHWITLAQQCHNAMDGPCNVSISQIRLKVSVHQNGDWKDIYFVEMVVPMGC